MRFWKEAIEPEETIINAKTLEELIEEVGLQYPLKVIATTFYVFGYRSYDVIEDGKLVGYFTYG